MAKSKIPIATNSSSLKNSANKKSNKKNKKQSKIIDDVVADSNSNDLIKQTTGESSNDDVNSGDKNPNVKKNKKFHEEPKSLKSPIIENGDNKRAIDSFDSNNNVDDDAHDEWISSVQNLFIWLMSAIYLFAFISFYMQIRGLYGNKGVLPLRYFAVKHMDPNESKSLDSINAAAPSLVWYLSSTQGLSLTSSLELISLCGSLIAFLQLIFDSCRTSTLYLTLFILYYSCMNVGQTFLYFQWDTFLLECGALTVLVSIRFTPNGSRSFLNRFRPHPSLVLWTVRWLLFKFMLSSGIVKFTARCPLWWSLRALDVHFESQPLPTPLAWYFHQLPSNWLHLAVVIHFVFEIIVPFMFFTPFRSLKLFAFITQIFLQIAIALAGNYNFFNLLTMVLCVTLLDDDMLMRKHRNKSEQQRQQSKKNSIELYVFGAILGIITYYTVYYFNIEIDWQNLAKGPTTNVNFTLDQFNLFVIQIINASIILGIISFIAVAIIALYKCFTYGGIIGRIIHFFTTIFYIIICLMILLVSFVPLAELDTTGHHMRTNIPIEFQRWYQTAQKHHLVSSYGLFRVMTGDGGRPELIIEGSDYVDNNNNGDWQPYYFRYKPVDLYKPPSFVIPHQPRLDWQMWFAALDNYQNNPWLLHLCYRILTGESDVLNLLDTARLPFKDKPPKFLRISRYLYKYTESRNDRAWWRKVSNRHAYLPMVTKDTLESALKLLEMSRKMSPALKQAQKDHQLLWMVKLLNDLNKFLTINNQWLTVPVIIYTIMSIVFVINYFKKF